MEILKLVAVFSVGVVGSIVGAIAGSGGLINIPFLIFLGLPPQVAIATHKFGSAGMKIGAAIKFRTTPHINWSYFWPFAVLSFIAAFLGAQLLIAIDKELLSRIIAFIILAILPFLFVKKEMGVVHQETSRLKHVFGYILYFFSQVYGAFFGGGAATISFYVLMTFFGFTIVEASASTTLPSLVMTLVALLVFAFNGMLDYEYGIATFLGMLVGGWLGAHIAVKKGNAWVKVFFILIVVLSALKLLFS